MAMFRHAHNNNNSKQEFFLACVNGETGVWPTDWSQKRLGQSSVGQKQKQD